MTTKSECAESNESNPMRAQSSPIPNLTLGNRAALCLAHAIKLCSIGAVGKFQEAKKSGMKLKLNQQSKPLLTYCVPRHRLWASGRCDKCRISLVPFVLFVILVAIAVTSSAPFVTATEDEPKSAEQEIKAWIEDLGSENYSKRQLATLRLSKRNADSMPFVIQAANDATGEKADRLFQFLSSIASDPYSESGKKAFDSLNQLAALRTTSKSIRAEKILQVIGAEQRDAAINLLDECKATLRDFRKLQVMSGSVDVKQPLVIDRKFTGNAADLACLKWLTDVQFVRLEGPQISREILQQVIALPHLKKLQLIETELTAKDLVVLRDAPDLDLLEIVYSPMGDESAELLTSLPVWGNVYLFGTKLTQSGEQTLKSKLDGIELFVSRGGFLGVVALGTSTVINEAVFGGAAEKAGLLRGDKMLSVNNVPITLFEDLRKQLAKFADGEKVTIEFERVIPTRLDLPFGEFPQGPLLQREKFQAEVTLGRRTDFNRER